MNFLGDGVSKSFSAVLASDPYGDVTVEKLECIGHVANEWELVFVS